MRKHIPVFSVFIFFILGCASIETVESTKIPPTEIYQDYSIFARKNHTAVTVTLRVGTGTGTTVDLDAPCKIERNGQEMTESASSFLKGTTYHYYSNRFEPAHQFVYTDASGKIYRNSISIEPIEIQAENLTLSRSQKTSIPLSRPLTFDEDITFSLHSQDKPPIETNSNLSKTNSERYSSSAGVHLDKSRTSFTIDRSQLERFALGKATLKIELRKNESLKQATPKGGSIASTYESQIVSVNILN